MLLVLAILIPPLGVYMAGGRGNTLILNIILTLLVWVPGAIHAVMFVKKSSAGGGAATGGSRR